MSRRSGALELIDLLTDEDSFESWDTDVVSTDPLAFVDTVPYATRLQDAEWRAGVNESIVCGSARIGGHEVVVIAGEFRFLAGTLGVASAERVIRAFERATQRQVPVVALPVSGGTRMQEGTAAFIQMAACAAAVRRFRDAGLLYVAYLRHPTTGGVLGSWASLAHVLWAAPEALIGLTGPRVAELMTGAPFPEDVQTAEHLREHGVIDEVVAVEDLPDRLRRVLGLVGEAEPFAPAVPAQVLDTGAAVEAWTAVEHSRRTDRPGVREVLAACGADVEAIRGDGAGEDDGGCLVGLARVCGISVVLVAQDRPPGERGASLHAAGYRKALRGMTLASELGLPLVTMIDTAGAGISAHDEETGLARMIAQCLAELSRLSTPTVSLLLGEGAGGGAIALLPADRVIAMEHSWLSPIAPEGASAILHRTTEHAPKFAAAAAIASTDLRRLGIVDSVVADADGEGPQRVAAVLHEALADLVEQDPSDRMAARLARYRTVAR